MADISTTPPRSEEASVRWKVGDELGVQSTRRPTSDFFPYHSSDLLCSENSADIESEYYLPISIASPVDVLDVDGLMAELAAADRCYQPGYDHKSSYGNLARHEAIAWILKVHAYYHFQPITAYISVSYMDRFLYSHSLPEASNGWPLQLLAVATLSVAAKMEETLVPSLLDLQINGARFIFEPRTIQRMELLVLDALDWKLRSVTPFDFIDFFSFKLDPSGVCSRFLVSRATQIILSTIHEAKFLDHRPSSIAAAAIICAADSLPRLSPIYPEDAGSWCVGLSKEKIVSCFELMQQVVLNKTKKGTCKYHKPPKIVPQIRAMTEIELGYSCTTSSCSPSQKRRKLNSSLWVYDNNGNHELSDHAGEEFGRNDS